MATLPGLCRTGTSRLPTAAKPGIGISGEEPAAAIYLTCDTNSPDPNTEVTVYVFSDVNLSSMDMIVTVTGDANITTAMGTVDCNQYGWDQGWSWDPYIDPNGWVEFGGISLAGQATGTVGYFKFIYHSGQVTVSITADSDVYDGNSQPVTFSTDPLIFGGESMQSSQQQSMMQRSTSSQLKESATMDSPPVNQQQSSTSPQLEENATVDSTPVDVNDLADWLENSGLKTLNSEALPPMQSGSS